MSQYRNPALRKLRDSQLEFAEPQSRLEQIERAERLLNELDPNRTYQYPELCERITRRRGDDFQDVVLTGADAMHDLRCFVEDLSDSADISVDNAGEEVWTVDDLSRRYSVSTKTVARWRDKGLVSRRFRFGGRKRVGFLKSSVERFVVKHLDEVQRGSRFTQLSLDEREQLIERARHLARTGARPTDISQRLAIQFGRSPVTVRYTLKDYDRENPDAAIFPQDSHLPTHERSREIYLRFSEGTSIETLARDFNRSQASIHRAVAEIRAEQILSLPIDFVDSPDFHVPDAERMILGAAPASSRKALLKAPTGLPPYLDSLYEIPLLTKDEEVYYFRKMNYLKFKAWDLREKIDPDRARLRDLDEMENLLQQAADLKNLLIRSNLRLVVSIAKKKMKYVVSFFDAISDGNMSLIRAIERFDYSRGFKFSTYASWAIIKNYTRSIPAERIQMDRFRTGNEEILNKSFDERGDGLAYELTNHRQHQALMGILSQLSDRERDIIMIRYGLSEGASPQTLEQVGLKLGVTKERIRQLESRALSKMRKIAVTEHLDVPGI